MPDPSQMEDRKQQRTEYDRQRDQTPERREYQRLRQREKVRRAKELGLCKSCPNPAKPGQTRCPTCAEKHHEYNRRSNAKRRDMAGQ